MCKLFTRKVGLPKMLYDEIRGQIKNGDILAWSGGGWGSWREIKISIVRIWTRSEYSHIGIAYVDKGRVFVLEAVAIDGVRIAPLSEDLPFYYIPCRKALSEKAMEYAFSKIGEKYSTWQAILGGLNLLRNGKDKKWQCAEYLIKIWNVDGELNGGIPPTPAHIMRHCNKLWGAMSLVH